MSRIEQLISDIEAYIDNCKYQPFSNNKIIVDKDQLEDMLSELRLKTPDEIKKYQKILNNKDYFRCKRAGRVNSECGTDTDGRINQ
jgi:hypothetical protein